MNSLAIINTTAPFGHCNYRESLDMLLANASYDRPVGLFFIHDGVYQLLKQTQGSLTGQKDLSKNYGLLSLYDVEDIFVCQASLQARQLSPQQLAIDVTVLDHSQWFATLNQFHQAVSF